MAAVRQAAQKAHAGAYAAPLANLDQAEQAARDVAARRQADNKVHAAWVIGQQGKLAAIGQSNDQRAAAQTAAVQGATLQGNAGLGRGMQAAREAQGIKGTVPSQQIAGLADESARQNLILGAATQRSVDRSNTNAGKAGFVSAAALANMNAQSRAIAGDEFNQTQAIRREKTGLLADEANMTMQQRAAEAAAQADIAKAEIAAAARDADRASRENIAGAQIDARRMEGETDREFTARQNRANRKVRLKTASQTAAALGGTYVRPADLKAYRDEQKTTSNAATLGSAILRGKNAAKYKADPVALRGALRSEYPNLSTAGLEFVVSQLYGREPGKGKKGAAQKRYKDYLKKIRQGQE